MKTFKFNGESDDTFGEYIETNTDYDNCANGTPIQFELLDASMDENGVREGVIVTGVYMGFNKSPCWMIGVNAIDEDFELSEWSFDLSPEYGGYKNQLTINAPDTVELRCLNSGSDV